VVVKAAEAAVVVAQAALGVALGVAVSGLAVEEGTPAKGVKTLLTRRPPRSEAK
jgi:hypothetical protein